MAYGIGVRLISIDVHFVSPAPVPSSWERRALARLQKPRWSVALPGTTLENWQWMYETDLESASDSTPYHNSSNNAFASCKSGVSNPSVNQV